MAIDLNPMPLAVDLVYRADRLGIQVFPDRVPHSLHPRVRAFVARFIPDADKRLMAKFTVHLDESYGTANAYSVAGFVATVEQWAELEREFKELAAKMDYKVLHKADLEHFWGEFEWPYLSQEERVARRSRLTNKFAQ